MDKSRLRQPGGGSGIGVISVCALVEAHEGSIKAESAGNEKGSVFVFTLPITKQELM